MLDTSVELSQLLRPDGYPVSSKPRINTTGRETLQNAVRDFVKSDSQMLKSLRSLDATDSCITHALIWLRRLTLALAVTSGVFSLLAVLSKFDVWTTKSEWHHILGFITSGALLCAAVVFMWRIMHSVNIFEGLKDKHADLP